MHSYCSKMSKSPLQDFTTHKSNLLKNERVHLCGICSRAPPIRSRALRGHYEGTKSWLGHYRGQQISTGGNGKNAGNALASTKLKRVEKAFLHFGKEEVTSSNLVNSSKNLHVVSGSFRGCVLFGFMRKAVVRHLVRQSWHKNRQYKTGNRRRSYSTSGRLLFYTCSLSFHAMLCKKLCVIQKSRRRIISHPTTAFLCILELSKIS